MYPKGSHILQSLLTTNSISQVHAFTRRKTEHPAQSKFVEHVETDSTLWSKQVATFAKKQVPELFISALGTTRGSAGSFEAQRKIDYELNLQLAKTAKEAGVKVYVLISSGGANAKSMFPYMKMKGELEESVKALAFEHTVILRPGLLLGPRGELRVPELISQKLAGLCGMISTRLHESWAVDADVVAKAAIKAGIQAATNENKELVWEVNHAQIIDLGKTTWKS